MFGGRPWDGPIQCTVDAVCEVLRAGCALDGVVWKIIEASFLMRAVQRRVAVVRQGHVMMREESNQSSGLRRRCSRIDQGTNI